MFELRQITNLVCVKMLSFAKVCYFITACLVVRLVLTEMFCTRLVWESARDRLWGMYFLKLVCECASDLYI